MRGSVLLYVKGASRPHVSDNKPFPQLSPFIPRTRCKAAVQRPLFRAVDAAHSPVSAVDSEVEQVFFFPGLAVLPKAHEGYFFVSSRQSQFICLATCARSESLPVPLKCASRPTTTWKDTLLSRWFSLHMSILYCCPTSSIRMHC